MVTSSLALLSCNVWAAKRCLTLLQAGARGSHILSLQRHGSVLAGRENLCAGHQPHKPWGLQQLCRSKSKCFPH